MAHAITTETTVTIGLDLGDRQTAGCVVDEGGQIFERFEARTPPTRLLAAVTRWPGARVVLEVGAQRPELAITKAGDALLRRYLVTAAQDILGPFGPDTDLRRRGLRLAGRGERAPRNGRSWRSPASWRCYCIGCG